jgi:hypothetical protein
MQAYSKLYDYTKGVLLLQKFSATGATLAEMHTVFAASGFQVLTVRQVEDASVPLVGE